MFSFVHEELPPYLKRLRDKPGANVERTRIDTERNFLDVIDKVHEISADRVDPTHVFTLSQVYEGLLLKMRRRATTAASSSRRARSSALWCGWWTRASEGRCTSRILGHPKNCWTLIEAKGREVAVALEGLRALLKTEHGGSA
jgi:hypothetical protein